MDYPREVYKQSMFFPDMTKRDEAARKISQNYQGKGTYLLRPSSTGDCNYFSLSIRAVESLKLHVQMDFAFNHNNQLSEKTDDVTMNVACIWFCKEYKADTYESDVHHVKINIEYQEKAPPKYYVASTIKFSSLTQLLDFYSHYEIHVQENIKDLKLLHPLIHSSPEIVRKGSLNSQGEELSHGSQNFDPSITGQKPSPVYLELQNEPNEYLKTESPSLSFKPQIKKTVPIEKQSIKISSPLKGKEKAKLGLKSKIFSKVRSKSVSQPPVMPIVEPSGKMTRSYSQQNPSDVPLSLHDRRHHCRPPAPLPPQNIPKSDEVIYSFVDPDHDFFEETYKFLKESEICECGLRLTDSELPDGWAVHFSKDEPTVDFIFFQRGDVTTWDIPEEILPSLSKKQISFILKLCHKRPCPIPSTLTQFIKSEFTKKNCMSTSPIQAAPVRKGSLPSSLSALSLSFPPSGGPKVLESKAQRKESSGFQTVDKNDHFTKADELPVSKTKDQSEMADHDPSDNGCYETAEQLFVTNSVKGFERDTSPISQETELKVQAVVRRFMSTPSSRPESHPYVMEDVEADSGSDISQHVQKRSRASSLTSSSKSSSSLSDCARPSSKQVTFEVPLKGNVLDETSETEPVKRKSEALIYSFKTLSASGNISSQDAVLSPGPVELIAVASPSTRLSQHQLLQLQQQPQVPSSQWQQVHESPYTQLSQHQLLQLQQQPQVSSLQWQQAHESPSTQVSQRQPLQLQQQQQVPSSQWQQVHESPSTQLSQHQLLQLQQQPQVPSSQWQQVHESPSSQLSQHQLLHLQQKPQVPSSQWQQVHESPSAQLTQHQLLQLQQQSQLPSSQRQHVPERISHFYQMNDTKQIIHDETHQFIPQGDKQQQQHQLYPEHLQQITPSSTLQSVQIINDPNLQHLSGQSQLFVDLQQQQLVKDGDQPSQNSGQATLQEAVLFQGHSQNRQSIPGFSKHPSQIQQRAVSVDGGQIFYVFEETNQIE